MRRLKLVKVVNAREKKNVKASECPELFTYFVRPRFQSGPSMLKLNSVQSGKL
jgi:hypothetical protein